MGMGPPFGVDPHSCDAFRTAHHLEAVAWRMTKERLSYNQALRPASRIVKTRKDDLESKNCGTCGRMGLCHSIRWQVRGVMRAHLLHGSPGSSSISRDKTAAAAVSLCRCIDIASPPTGETEQKSGRRFNPRNRKMLKNQHIVRMRIN